MDWKRRFESSHQFNSTYSVNASSSTHILSNLRIAIICVCSIISVFSIMGNLLSLIAISRSKYWRTPNGLLLTNLAIVDFLLGLICLPLVIAVAYAGQNVPTVLCQIQAFSLGVLNCTSINTAVIISIDRYIAVAQPYYHAASVGRSKVIKAIVTAWSLSAIMSSIPIIAQGKYGLGIYDNRNQICWFFMRDYAKNHIINSIFITAMLLAIAIVLFCYAIMFGIAYQKSIATPLYHFGSSYRNIKKTIFTTTLIVGTKIICWLPLSVVSVLDACTTVPLTPLVGIMVYFFAFANSALNPMIYIATSSTLRLKVLQLIHRNRRVNNLVTVSSTFTRNT